MLLMRKTYLQSPSDLVIKKYCFEEKNEKKRPDSSAYMRMRFGCVWIALCIPKLMV